MNIDALAEEFQTLGTWEERSDLLIDLGIDLPKLPAHLKTDDNRIHGCRSNAWLAISVRAGDPPVIDFAGDADAVLVSGLIAVLLAAYSHKTPREILEVDIDAVFRRLEIDRHILSLSRSGIQNMVARIRDVATSQLGGALPARQLNADRLLR